MAFPEKYMRYTHKQTHRLYTCTMYINKKKHYKQARQTIQQTNNAELKWNVLKKKHEERNVLYNTFIN